MASDVGIVLSHWLNPDGSLSDETRERVDKSIELWKSGEIDYIIMTGDHKLRGQNFKFSLSDAMKRYAVEHGVDEKRVIEEDVSLETVGNILFSSYGIVSPRNWKKLKIITHEYQMGRAKEIAEIVFGNNCSLEYSSVDSGNLEDPSKSIEIFRNTYRGIEKGDNESMLERTLQKHGIYNAEPEFFKDRLENLRDGQRVLSKD